MADELTALTEMDVPEITDDMTNSLKTDVGSLCSFIRVFRSLKRRWTAPTTPL
jgi:hypothetical protein